jgi:hypothetical protein
LVDYHSKSCDNIKLCDLISTDNNRLKIMTAGAGGNNVTYITDLIPSVRLYTEKELFNGGLFSFEIFHIPSGCGVWPSIWFSQDSHQLLPNGNTGNWPSVGEIDLIEQVSDNNTNSTTLHIDDKTNKCTPIFTPISKNSNCDANRSGNTGCGIEGPIDSFGMSFNNKYVKKGAAYVMYWDMDKTIKTWLIPGDSYNSISGPFGSNPNPDSWGEPYAIFDMSKTKCIIKDQQIIINITLCGNWAGQMNLCKTDTGGKSCSDWVHNPDNIRDAFWDIGRVSIYTENKKNIIII